MRQLKNILHLLNAVAANIYYRFPSRSIQMIGITGTDGKSTTTHLTYHILKEAGKKASMISTVYAKVGGKAYDTGFHVTTPSPWFLQKMIRKAVDAGDDYFVLEVTSHGLDQNRVWGISYDYGVLTNVTHEHLDYHGTYEEYLRTKVKLLQRSKCSIFLAERDPALTRSRKKITFGLRSGDISLQTFPFTTSLPGEYNKLNCLAASAVAREIGIPDGTIRRALKSFTGIEGRMEEIQTGRDFRVIIDFAHTPNAMEQVLKTVRPTISGRLIHVFGCAGLRDHAKRPMMGKISARYADIIVLTEEDTRTERIEDIMEEIKNGMKGNSKFEIRSSKQIQNSKIKKTGKVIYEIPDRQDAVDMAISLAGKGDLVIMTGKGHEKSLCRGTVEYPWSEHEAVRKALGKVKK